MGAGSRSSGQSSDGNAQAVSASNTHNDYHHYHQHHHHNQQALLTGAVLDRHCDAMKTLMVKNHRKCRVHGMYGLNTDRKMTGKSASSLNTRLQSSKHSCANSRTANRSCKNSLINRSVEEAIDTAVMPATKSLTSADAIESPSLIEVNAGDNSGVIERRERKPELEMWPPFSASLPVIQQLHAPHGRANVVEVLLVCYRYVLNALPNH